MIDRAWQSVFADGMRALAIEPPEQRVLAGLETYVDQLQFWNKKINLTAIRGAENIAQTHFVDSAAVLLGVPDTARTLLDAGSGAGFPGMVVALMRPDLAVELCESNSKKCAFLRALQRELRLDNVNVIAGRLEDVEGPVDVAVSRATWEVGEWLTIGARLAKPKGVVIGMEGARQCQLPAEAKRISYKLADSKRSLVVW